MKRLILIAVALIVAAVPVSSFSAAAAGACFLAGMVLLIVAVIRGIANRGKTKHMSISVGNLGEYIKNVYSLSSYNSTYSYIRSASDGYDGFKIYSSKFDIENIRPNFEPGGDGTYIVKINGAPIGTISAGDAEAVLALERKKKIKSMFVEITGGEYKAVIDGQFEQDYEPYIATIEIEHKL